MIKSKKEDDSNFEKIKVFSSEDEQLKLLGELLSNKSSRDIIKLLMNEEHYTNEIANKLDLRPNLVIHHLKKLREVGLLEIRNKKFLKKGNDHKYFRITPGMLIFPTKTKEDIKDEGFFKKIKSSAKFAVIGLTAGLVWFYQQTLPSTYSEGVVEPFLDSIKSLALPLIIIIVGLVTIMIFSQKRK